MSSTNGRKPARRSRPSRPSRPYRDSVLLYAVLGAAVVVVAFATGGGLLRALVGGVSAFVLATAWTWWRLRARERAAAGERQAR